MYGGLAAEFFVCQVADGDEQVAVVADVGDVAGAQGQAAAGGSDGAGLDVGGGDRRLPVVPGPGCGPGAIG